MCGRVVPRSGGGRVAWPGNGVGKVVEVEGV